VTVFKLRLDIRKLSEEDKDLLVEALEYCRSHDKTGDFRYAMTDRGVYIPCRSYEQAVKRGRYFKYKFNTPFMIIREREGATGRGKA
jgi:hypothetical protein